MSSVHDFYRDQSILITGATGFLGKVLLEKILRSLPDVTKVYCLIRTKKNQNANQRLEQMLQNKLFEGIRISNPDCLAKVIAVTADIAKPNLGLTNSDMSRLIDCVSIVFHSAATVKFDEALRTAVDLNVVGTQRLLELTKQMPNLRAFVHISSAFANCDHVRVEECVYPSPVLPEQIVGCLEWMPDTLLSILAQHLVGNKPNTYTFTKSIAEYVVSESMYNMDIPVVIVRPSIIGAVWKEPIPGWTENWNGPNGIFAATGKGLLRSMVANPNGAADIVPVDVVANLLIVAAWSTANHDYGETPVINCCSSEINPVRWKQISTSVVSTYRKVPMEDSFRMPQFTIYRNSHFHKISIALEHWLPAILIDIYMVLAGRGLKMTRLNQKVQVAAKGMTYFTNNQFSFGSKNMITLQTKLSAEDSDNFGFEIESMNWKNYLETFCVGVKTHVLKESLEKVARIKRQHAKIQQYANLAKFIVLILGVRFLLKRSEFIRRFAALPVDLVLKLLKFGLQLSSKTVN